MSVEPERVPLDEGGEVPYTIRMPPDLENEKAQADVEKAKVVAANTPLDESSEMAGLLGKSMEGNSSAEPELAPIIKRPELESGIAKLLAEAELTQFAAAIAAADYLELGDLLDADADEIGELVKMVEMSKPAARRFRKAIASLGGAQVETHSARPQASLQQEGPERRAFFSLRFGDKHGVQPMAEALQAALAPKGVEAKIINMKADGNIKKEVFSQIEACGTFVAFGSKHYGEDTGNSASTYAESAYVEGLTGANKKKIIRIRMIPFEEGFEHLQGRTFFGMNDMVEV